MKIQIDRDTTLDHIVGREPGADYFHGNGTGHIFGGDGSYRINAGITPVDDHGVPLIFGFDNDHDGVGDHMLRVYGTGSLPGFGVPDQFVFGNPGAPHQFDQGEKIGDIGYGQEWKGSGPNIVFIHGPSPHSPYEAEVYTGNHTAVVIDHSDGYRIKDIHLSHTEKVGNHHVSDLDTFEFISISDNAFIHANGDQHVEIHVGDDHRSLNFHPVQITWSGHSAHDEVAAWVADHVAPNNAPVEAPTHADDFVFF